MQKTERDWEDTHTGKTTFILLFTQNFVLSMSFQSVMVMVYQRVQVLNYYFTILMPHMHTYLNDMTDQKLTIKSQLEESAADLAMATHDVNSGKLRFSQWPSFCNLLTALSRFPLYVIHKSVVFKAKHCWPLGDLSADCPSNFML